MTSMHRRTITASARDSGTVVVAARPVTGRIVPPPRINVSIVGGYNWCDFYNRKPRYVCRVGRALARIRTLVIAL